MKLYINMPQTLKPFYKRELKEAKLALEENKLDKSWQHLERAHILGQPYPFEHTTVHYRMICFGIKIKNGKEVLGQIPRLLFGGVKSFVGKIPIGNTGGSNVPPLEAMEIPDDLKTIIRQNSD